MTIKQQDNLHITWKQVCIDAEKVWEILYKKRKKYRETEKRLKTFRVFEMKEEIKAMRLLQATRLERINMIETKWYELSHYEIDLFERLENSKTTK